MPDIYCWVFAFTFVISFSQSTIHAQNLVPNPSFEEHNGCYIKSEDVKYWGNFGLPVYNNCSFNQEGRLNKNDIIPQKPHEGKTYTSILSYYNYYEERTAISAPLLEPLKQGYQYYLRMYSAFFAYANSNNWGDGYRVSNNIGIRLYTVRPKIERVNTAMISKSGYNHLNTKAPILPSEGWKKIYNTIIADSCYNWIVIGNFFPDSLTRVKKVLGENAKNLHVNYAIDNIMVHEIPRIMHNKEIHLCKGDSFQVRIKGGSDYFWSTAKNAIDTFSTDSSFWLKPTNNKTTLYINSVNKEVQERIDIFVHPPPRVKLGKDSTICYFDSLKLSAQNPGASYTWADGYGKSERYISKPGTYHVKAQTGSCSDADTITIDQFEKPKPLKLSGESIICAQANEKVNLTVNSFPKIKWSDGSNGSVFITDTSGTFNVWVTDSNNCTQRDSLNIKNRCEPTAFIPNAFSPNSDGLNDKFKLSGYGYSFIHLSIYNRFGQLIFSKKGKDVNWDGRVDNKFAPIGTYFYQATISPSDAYYKKEVRTGTVQIVK